MPPPSSSTPSKAGSRTLRRNIQPSQSSSSKLVALPHRPARIPPSTTAHGRLEASHTPRKAQKKSSLDGSDHNSDVANTTPERKAPRILEFDDDGRILIEVKGNLLLQIHSEDELESFTYRVSSSLLMDHSAYFSRLLHASKFGEGTQVAEQHKSLEAKYGSSEVAPAEELPTVSIKDVGRISSKVRSIQGLMADFLRMLHGQTLATTTPSLSNIANLIVVADRFDALPFMIDYVHEHRYLQPHDSKYIEKNALDLTEERARWGLFIGMMLDYEKWVVPASKRLVLLGSTRWSEDVVDDECDALWWDIPMGLEEELVFRHEHILETVRSIPSHFLKLYTYGEMQCKLGYDNSAQCDSFQLGEMVRFFARNGCLRLDEIDAGQETPLSSQGALLPLIDKLRQCPSYQIDRNHAHCGLRARMIPLLDLLECILHSSMCIAICPECWRNNRREYAWRDAKGPLIWTRNAMFTSSRPKTFLNARTAHTSLRDHFPARDLFLATDRDWTARDT